MWKIDRGATKYTDAANLYDGVIYYEVEGERVFTYSGRVNVADEQSKIDFKANAISAYNAFLANEASKAQLVTDLETYLNS